MTSFELFSVWNPRFSFNTLLQYFLDYQGISQYQKRNLTTFHGSHAVSSIMYFISTKTHLPCVMILYRRKKCRKCHPGVSVLLSSLMLKNRFAELLQRQSVLHLCAVSAEQIANIIVKAMSLPNDPQVKFSRKLACLFSLAAFSILQLLPEIQWYHCLNREQSALKYLVCITPLHDTLKRLAPLIHPIRIATRLHTFSRAQHQLHVWYVFTTGFDWFVRLSVSFVIG